MRNLRRSRVVRRVFSALLCMALLIGSINVSGLTARADIGNDPEQPVYTLTEPAPSEDGQIQELPDVTNHAQENDIVNSDENNGTLVPENPTQVPEEPGEVAGEEQTTPEENLEEGQTLPEENPEEDPASPQEQPDAADEEPGVHEGDPEQVPEASGENPEQGQTAPEVNPEQGQTVPEENKDQDPAPQQEQPGAAEVTPDAPEVNPEQVPETPAENPEQEQPVPADGAGNEGQNFPAELPQNAEGSDAGKTEEQLSEENTSNEETEENAEIDYDALSEALEDTWMITAGERVNVREIPDAEGGIVAVIKEKGARVQVLARYTEDWLKIRIAVEDAELPVETADESAAETTDYVTGYVRADLLREERKYSYDADDLEDHEELEDMDFSARRLIVAIDDSDEIVEEESVLAVYEPAEDAADDTPVYLLSFDTEEKTKIAYLHYLDEAEFAEPDVALFVTDRSDDAAQEDAEDPEDETPDYELPEFGASDQSQEENAFDLLKEEMEKLLEEQEEERRRKEEAEEEAPHGMEDEDASEEAEDEAEEEDESPVIALLSTGVGSESGNYEALARRVRFVPDGDDYDLNGNGTGLYGILTEEAEDAKILSVSVLDEDGRGDLSMLYAGILYAAQYGADYIVLPMTAYLPDGSDALRSAIRFAEDKDITVIAAAGDYAEDAEDFVPASYGAVITVGAAKENGERRRASNYGSDVDVNVVAVDTAEAAARLAGILCREGITAEDFEELTLNEGAVFETGYVPPEKDLYARTTAEKVNVRAQASTDSDIVAVIGQKGTRVQVLYIIEQEDVWYRVRLLPNGKTQTADDAAQEGGTGEEDEDAEERIEGYIRSDLAELIEGDGAGYLYTEEELEALEEADFTAKRLIVSIPETEIVEEESVLAVYTPDGDESDEEAGLPVYLLQFDTEEEAKIAYLHYSAFAAFAEPDRTMRAAVIAESASAEDDMSETASGDAEESREISMSEDVNPLTVLEDLLEELEEKRAADREAAEQETQSEAPIRQQEDADTSSEHSQERRAVRQQEDGDEEVPSDEAEADNAPEDAAGDETVSGSDTADITAEDIRKETHTVAVLTSGVGAASASYKNLAGRVSLLGDDGHDTNGQGTRLYETILNAADNAQILPVKVLDENGEGAVSAVYAGILYAAQYGAEYLVLPVTMYTPETSGLSEQSAALRSAIDLACEAGITVIAAAGDYGADAADFMPAAADRVITTGSAAEDGLRRETSNYGDDVDVNVIAPTTGEAAAKLAGILCAEEITADSISDLKTNLYGGAVFTTSFTEEDLRYPGGVLRAVEGG
ncbi:MAG: SH3 domain-containing protein [Lachnospiraceae bacterium]|nr:SH3 domain-containing protein [Lachnospiraceae bacterium]